jgi:hypothetical protein
MRRSKRPGERTQRGPLRQPTYRKLSQTGHKTRGAAPGLGRLSARAPRGARPPPCAEAVDPPAGPRSARRPTIRPPAHDPPAGPRAFRRANTPGNPARSDRATGLIRAKPPTQLTGAAPMPRTGRLASKAGIVSGPSFHRPSRGVGEALIQGVYPSRATPNLPPRQRPGVEPRNGPACAPAVARGKMRGAHPGVAEVGSSDSSSAGSQRRETNLSCRHPSAAPGAP